VLVYFELNCVFSLSFICFLYKCFGSLQNCLADVMGLVTGISPEREYVRDGKLTKMIVVELTDSR
jgi:hypothetical protein